MRLRARPVLLCGARHLPRRGPHDRARAQRRRRHVHGRARRGPRRARRAAQRGRRARPPGRVFGADLPRAHILQPDLGHAAARAPPRADCVRAQARLPDRLRRRLRPHPLPRAAVAPAAARRARHGRARLRHQQRLVFKDLRAGPASGLDRNARVDYQRDRAERDLLQWRQPQPPHVRHHARGARDTPPGRPARVHPRDLRRALRGADGGPAGAPAAGCDQHARPGRWLLRVGAPARGRRCRGVARAGSHQVPCHLPARQLVNHSQAVPESHPRRLYVQRRRRARCRGRAARRSHPRGRWHLAECGARLYTCARITQSL
eukprot:Unigene446_Nuclearia_a/m.1461 Unigene446_Nuclearia_a/g.1461  ORF Unigene446_Nuclearia_a/g.1461 Unigene446_Nuclearia_a/m.1461 type:complete len:319 (+) Unigene446_Nuclearia_a:405-1361(+)